MLAVIKTEFQKIKRYHILLIGMTGMLCSPLLQLFSQMVMTEEYKDPNYDFPAFMNATIWGNAEVFMPVIFTLIGGYLISREYTDDTLKNILTVPVSFRKFLAGKLAAIGLLAVLFSIYNVVITLIVGLCAKLSAVSVPVLAKGLLQMIGLSICIYIVVLPIITLCSRKPGSFMGGSVVAFLTGYCVLFFKNGLMRNIYPFSASLTMIGFDTGSYNGASGKGSLPLAVLSLGTMLAVTAVLVFTASMPENNTHSPKKRKKKGMSSRSPKRGRGGAD